MSGLFVGIHGLGNSLFSEGIDEFASKAMAEGWQAHVFEHYDHEIIKSYIQEYHRDGEPLVAMGHSMGADTLDDLAETGIPIDLAVFVASALKENVPNHVKHVLWIWASGDWRKFKITGGAVNEHITYPNTTHTNIDNLEAMHDKVLGYMRELQPDKEPDMPTQELPITTKVASELAFHEGLVQEAYLDSVGVRTWSIGITSKSGHLVDRYIGNPATIERCIEVYIWLLDTKYAPKVRETFAGHELTEAQFAAALSFHWNTGAIHRAEWVKAWKAGRIAEARAEILNWNIPASIIPRRRAERDLFFSGEWSGDGTTLHYRGVSAGGSPISPIRLDISEPIQRAIQKHYSPQVPIDPETPQPPTAPDMDNYRQELQRLFPNLDASQTDMVLALTYLLGRDKPPDRDILDIQPNQPALEAGFSLPTEGTLNMKNFFQSKTIWGIGTMAISQLLPTVLPVLGYDFNSADAQELLGAVEAIGGGVGAILAIYGRMTATKQLAFRVK